MSILDALHNWQNFFFMAGGAAATLVGLMFVALSLGSHLITPENTTNIRIYVNPTLFHFVTVFVAACVMLIPTHTRISLIVCMGAIGMVGIGKVISVIRHMKYQLREAESAEGHWIWHGILPFLSYGAVCIAAGLMLLNDQTVWIEGLAIMTVILLVCAIHNVWVLVLWVLSQR